MKQRKSKPIVYLFLLLASLVLSVILWGGLVSSAETLNPNRFKGEQFEYAIKKFGITAGTAILSYEGIVDLEGQKLVLIVFTADGFNFYDQEKIYADSKTLLPVRVERDLNIFGNKEQLTEFYDMQKYTVRIVKYKGGEQAEEMSFDKDHPIDNLYCFLFRYRMTGVYEEGAEFQMHLPTKDVQFEILQRKKTKLYAGVKETWFMQSQPREYRVWFGADDDKLPLRIDGAVGLANTAMILRNYSKDKIQ